MTPRQKRFQALGFLVLLIVSGLLWGCGASGAQVDEDGDTLEEGRCRDSADCTPPLMCRDTYCIDEDDPDGDVIPCTSNFQCPVDMKCHPTRKVCVPFGAQDGDIPDGDDDGDLDDDDEMDAPDGDLDDETDSDGEEEPPPDILVYFVQPANRAVVGGTVTVEVGIVSDFTIDRVEFYAFGGKIGERDQEPWTLSWDTLTLDEHPEMELRAVAYSGDTVGVGRIIVTVDHSDPVLSILSPEENQELGFYDNLDVVVEAGDHLKTLWVYVDSILVETLPISEDLPTYMVSIDLDYFSPGQHWLEVEVEDQVPSHAKPRVGRFFRVDNSAPAFSVEGVTWSQEDANIGEIFAETQMVFRMDDVSGLAMASLTVSDGSRNLISLTDPTRFPLTVEDFNALLVWPDVVYPVTLTITASATDNFGNQTPTHSKTVTVKRLKWVYDPATGNPTFSPPPAFKQRIGASAGDSGNLYAPLYTELHAISPQGTYRWHCDAGDIFATVPVVVEHPGAPALVLASTQGGRLWAAADLGNSALCRSHDADINLQAPAPPVVDSVSYIGGVLTVTLYHCAQKQSDTRCFKLSAIYTPAQGEDEATLTFSPVWSTTYTGYAPPTTLALPRESSFTKLLTSAGRQIMLLDPGNGNPSPVSTFGEGELSRSVAPVPGTDLLMACGSKICRSFTLALGVLNNRVLPAGTDDVFLGGQPVSDEEGVVYINTIVVKEDVPTGAVQAMGTGLSGFVSYPWEFITEGLPGGTLALGQGRMLYVAGERADGNIWALDLESALLPETPPRRREAWKIKLNTEFFSPLLITPGGDLIAVGSDAKIRSVDIRGNAPLNSQTAWPQYQGQPSRSGYWYYQATR